MPNRLIKLRALQEKGKCSICMDFIKADQAELPCSHDQFCFGCIWGWSEIHNKCPLCMEKFFSIKNKDKSQFFFIEDKTKDSEVDIEIEILCEVCLSGDNEENLLLCDTCDKGFHTECIGLTRIPYLENWFCDTCIKTKPKPVQKAQDLEVSRARQYELPVKRSRRGCRNGNNRR